MAHRFFATRPLPASGILPLAEGDVHHIRTVLRVQPSESIEVVADGDVWRYEVTSVGEHVSGTRVERIASRPAMPRVTLAQALAKGDKVDTVVRQVTELGVARIVPFAAARSIVRLDAHKSAARAERWRRVAESAAKQARRADMPEVAEPVALLDLPGLLAGSAVLVCAEDAPDAPGIPEALSALATLPEDGVAVIVGPEGGFEPGEVAALTDAGAIAVSLGPTILRTKTAGVVAVALALAACGGLGNAPEPRGD
jgi:16S rRNA (uracil1498-N3)-methyltransferase